MFVITGATGNTGSVAVKALLSAGKPVRAVVRDAAKAKPLAELGAEIFVADLTDQAALFQAVQGAQGVSLISPPDLAATNFIADRKALTEKTSSNAGAGQGTARGLAVFGGRPARRRHGADPHHVQPGAAAARGRHPRHVRTRRVVRRELAAVLHAVKADGVLPSFIRADQAIPMVSTPDIGKAIAQALLDGPQGTKIIELSGPVPVSPNDVAAAFSKILGKPIHVVEAPASARCRPSRPSASRTTSPSSSKRCTKASRAAKSRPKAASPCTARRHSRPRCARSSVDWVGRAGSARALRRKARPREGRYSMSPMRERGG